MLPTIAIVGGFLGAGKTSALMAAAGRLSARGMRVGLITNDQGSDLVDAALVAQRGWAGAAVMGGCFCCRFDDLLGAAGELIASTRPDVLLAEPVGSCTDLVATVLRPLQRLYSQRLRVAPFSVLVDPLTLADRLPGSALFPADVAYLFERQIAEADLLALTRADLLDEPQRVWASDTLALLRPGVPRYLISSTRGDGLEAWLDGLMGAGPAGQSVLELDYDRYTRAEAALAWLNTVAVLAAPAPFAPDAWVETLLLELGAQLDMIGGRIAHLKAQVESGAGSSKASLLHTPGAVTFDARCNQPAHTGRALINARALCAPHQLEQALLAALAAAQQLTGAIATIASLQSFAPPPPQPTHRLGT